MTANDARPADHLDKVLSTQLLHLRDDLYQLTCASRFYHNAFYAITVVNKREGAQLDTYEQHGLHAIGEWIHGQGEALMRQLDTAINELRSR